MPTFRSRAIKRSVPHKSRVANDPRPATETVRWQPRPFVPKKLGVPWLAIALVAGMSFRTYHFANDPPIWHDEAALVYNATHKGWNELLGPLYYSEACPPLFLAFVKATIAALGDSSFAIRLMPLLASCISLALCTWMATRILPRGAAVWFALLMGCSNSLLWHSCEAKPYAFDVLIASALLALTNFGQIGKRVKQGDVRSLLVWLCLLAPPLIFFSFPACFLLAGTAAVVLPLVGRDTRRGTRLWYAAYCTLLGGSILVLYCTAVTAQKNEILMECWQGQFPAWRQPWSVPVKTIWQTTEVVRYAFYPLGPVGVLLGTIGAINMHRRGRGMLVALALAPVALNVIAWMIWCYPMNATRVVAYAVPGLLLLIAGGIMPVWNWLRSRHALASWALAAVMLIPVAQAPYRIIRPWQRLDSRTPAEFVLARRDAREAVVGVVWEQAYYLRSLGSDYRAIGNTPTCPQTLAPGAPLTGSRADEPADGIWLITHREPGIAEAHVAGLLPQAAWRVVERYEFCDYLVLRVRRE
jgi:hypothetical protein